MTFSTEWDALYQGNTHLSVWPWSDLVSYVHRYAHPRNGYARVLELGCGAGANIPLFLKLGAQYQGIDGSETIVERLRQTYPQLRDQLAVGDFTRDIPFEGPFDLVVDRVSLPHNDTAAIARTLRRVHGLLRPGGLLIGIDWFSDQHVDSARGERVDAHTRKNLPEDSHLANTGMVHFFDAGHLTDLLVQAGLEPRRLEHKQKRTHLPAGEALAWWDFVAVRP